jgi:hypothetical protein
MTCSTASRSELSLPLRVTRDDRQDDGDQSDCGEAYLRAGHIADCVGLLRKNL